LIAYLRGKLVSKNPPEIIIDVDGIGYSIQAPMSTFYELPKIDHEVTLLTQLIVREDSHTLYGFASDIERELFKQLLKVNKVGAKLALTILSGMSVLEFQKCIITGDYDALEKLPGVGRKMAERLLIEMKDRIKENFTDADTLQNPFDQTKLTPEVEALQALIKLGYKPNDAKRIVRKIDTDELTSEDIIKTALRNTLK
jgi:Holliday junction DNA helicase RuvA